MFIFHRAFHLAHYLFPEGGTCLEFGVWCGSSFIWQAKQLEAVYPKTKLIGFDSWQGLPEETSGVWRPERHRAGGYKSNRDSVTGCIPKAVEDRARLVDGWFRDTLTADLQGRIGDLMLVNLDVDLYGSAMEVLQFLGPLLCPGTLLYLDDWKDPVDEHEGTWGEHRAWEEWYVSQTNIKAELLESDSLQRRTMLFTSTSKGSLSHARIAEIRYKSIGIDT